MCSFTDEPQPQDTADEPQPQDTADAPIRVLRTLSRKMAVAALGETITDEFSEVRAKHPLAERVRAMQVHAIEFGYPVPPSTASVDAIEGMEFLALMDIAEVYTAAVSTAAETVGQIIESLVASSN